MLPLCFISKLKLHNVLVDVGIKRKNFSISSKHFRNDAIIYSHDISACCHVTLHSNRQQRDLREVKLLNLVFSISKELPCLMMIYVFIKEKHKAELRMS